MTTLKADNEIRNLIDQLLPILEKYNTGKIDYQIQKLKDIEEILDSDISLVDKQNMIQEVSKYIYPPQGGLTDFYVWNDDINIRKEINKPLSILLDKLWNLIK